MRSIAQPKIGESQQLEVMRRIYHQYSIDVEIVSAMSLGLSGLDEIFLTSVDGDCNWNTLSEDQQLLEALGRESVGANEVVVYFATTLRQKDGSTLQGCAGHLPGKPAAMIASTASDKMTMAHEVGHVLLTSSFSPVHEADSKNLMCSAPICTGNPATLNDSQLAQIRKSPMCL